MAKWNPARLHPTARRRFAPTSATFTVTFIVRPPRAIVSSIGLPTPARSSSVVRSESRRTGLPFTPTMTSPSSPGGGKRMDASYRPLRSFLRSQLCAAPRSKNGSGCSCNRPKPASRNHRPPIIAVDLIIEADKDRHKFSGDKNQPAFLVFTAGSDLDGLQNDLGAVGLADNHSCEMPLTRLSWHSARSIGSCAPRTGRMPPSRIRPKGLPTRPEQLLNFSAATRPDHLIL